MRPVERKNNDVPAILPQENVMLGGFTLGLRFSVYFACSLGHVDCARLESRNPDL